MRPIVSLLFFALLVAPVPFVPASAQTLVLGESRAGACFRHALSQRGDRRALADCDQALESDMLLGRDRAATHVNRGIVRMHSGDAEAALSDFDAAEAMSRISPSALALNRSSALLRLDRRTRRWPRRRS